MPVRICPKCQLELDTEEPFCPRDGTRLLSRSVYEQIAQETDPLVGQRISDRYLVIRKLGEGGMGDVYLGEHEEIEKRLALKVLKHEYSTRPDVVARFKQEAISASRIKHPNVVDVFDFGQLDDGRFFLAMELLEGKDLADVLAQEGVLGPDRGLGIALQMCRALIAAHAKGVVHRDLKPENVFLSRTEDGEETVKLVDFGIAKLRDVSADGTQEERRKLTKTGMIFGTPEYMAPEQAAGKNVDHRVDVYATGIILYEMFGGRVPFTGDTFMAVLTAHMTDPVPPIREVCPETQISAELEQAIVKSLQKKPAERHESMAAFAEALLQTPEGGSEGVARMSRVATPAATGSQQPEQRTASTPGAARAATVGDTSGDGSTQLALTSQATGPGRGKWVLGAVVGVVAVLGVAAGFGYRSQLFAGPPSAVPSEPISAAPASESPVASAEPDTSAAPASSSAVVMVDDPPDSVLIRIETKPEGAVIKKKDGDDLFQICPESPCDYPARPDEKIELVAEKGGMKGSAAVLARTSQTIVIELKRQGGSGYRPPAPPPTNRTNNCEFCVPKGDPDCIKVIRPCDKPPY